MRLPNISAMVLFCILISIMGCAYTGRLDREAIARDLANSEQVKTWGGNHFHGPYSGQRKSVTFSVEAEKLIVVMSGKIYSLRSKPAHMEVWLKETEQVFTMRTADLSPAFFVKNWQPMIFEGRQYGRDVATIDFRCEDGACIHRREIVNEKCVAGCPAGQTSPMPAAHEAELSNFNILTTNPPEAVRIVTLFTDLVSTYPK